jgi:hypothetical protein
MYLSILVLVNACSTEVLSAATDLCIAVHAEPFANNAKVNVLISPFCFLRDHHSRLVVLYCSYIVIIHIIIDSGNSI